jgi:hypothetical protein
MITRTYLKGCEWCQSTGQVLDGYPVMGTNVFRDCPVCNGSKTILVTEVVTNDNYDCKDINPLLK